MCAVYIFLHLCFPYFWAIFASAGRLLTCSSQPRPEICVQLQAGEGICGQYPHRFRYAHNKPHVLHVMCYPPL